MRRFILQLNNGVELPCRPSSLGMCDFDVIECDVPKDVFQSLVAAHRSPTKLRDLDHYHMGFNAEKLPVGASLRRIA